MKELASHKAKVLKNPSTGRLFLWTPVLAKSKHLEPAPELEAQAFLDELAGTTAGLKEIQISEKESYSQIKYDKIDPEFNEDIDISNFGKPQLLAIAAKIPGLQFPQSMAVGALRKLVQEALQQIADYRANN